MKDANTFGSSTAEIRRKELEKKQETKNNTARNIFDKRKKIYCGRSRAADFGRSSGCAGKY